MKKQWLLCYVGCSGSGKSTAARELKQLLPNVVELNRDEWRFKLFTDGVQDWSKYKFSKEKEDAVTAKLEELFYQAVANLSPIVVSNTNLNKKDQDYSDQVQGLILSSDQLPYIFRLVSTLLQAYRKRHR